MRLGMQKSFFDLNFDEKISDQAPLAVRMRPKTL
ncbi:MAG: hypothetical protein PWR12_2079, partial [Eubacteriaceae bacterium]|nr:hypothetical protein [Eubacteriaceae bacterium]